MSISQKSVSMEELSPLITELIGSGTDISITVTGNSMVPAWHHLRDTVVLTKCDPFKLKKYDIPLYKRENGQYVLHRIIKVHDNCFDLAGDAQSKIEKGLEKERVIAVTKSFTHKGKMHSCNEFFVKLYAVLWTFILPLRKYIFKIHRVLHGKKK